MRYVFGFDTIKKNGIPVANVNPYSNSESYGFLTYGGRKMNYAIETTYNLIKNSVSFMYLIDYRPGNDSEFFPLLDIPKEVIEHAIQGKCKVCIFAATEYASGRGVTEKMNELAVRYGLNKNALYFITGNLKATNEDADRFTYVSYNYFLDFPWFIAKDQPQDLDKVIPYVLKKKILCYNRRPHTHRKILVYNILNNPLLLENTMLSYGGSSNPNVNHLFFFQERIKDETLQKNMFDFFEENSSLEIVLDEGKMENNLADNFNLEHHQHSFISLVSETNIDSDKVFFSEKTYKPIYAQQPFIIYGNPHSLKYLKELGFKTFDKWIDESYDNEEDFEERSNKVFKVLEEISLKSFEELNRIREEMQEVLIHNYKHFLTLNVANDFIKNLEFNNRKVTKSKAMKRVFTFGCSFTAFSWPTWADMLIEDYKNKGLKGYNYGRCGAGNQFIFIKLMEANIRHKFTEDDLILICWTTMQREDRFADNRWITPGNIYSQNIYKGSFVNAWADPSHYVLRDCAIMEATALALKNIGCNFYQFSMSPLNQLNSADANYIAEETNNVLSFYKDYTKLDFPSMMEYLGLVDRSPEAHKKRPLTYWGHDNPKEVIAEWHPTVEEHYKYLQNVIQSKVHIELEDKTKKFVSDWINTLSTAQYPLDLNKTGWSRPNEYNDDIVNFKETTIENNDIIEDGNLAKKQQIKLI